LGDVHATLQLLSLCWERLLQLAPSMQEEALDIMGKGSEGYRLFFSALPKATAKKTPTWLHHEATSFPLPPSTEEAVKQAPPKKGRITLREEPLDPLHLPRLIAFAAAQAKPHWFAVKNLDAVVRRLPQDLLKEDIRIVYPPSHLLDTSAAKTLRESPALTADEASLALKIAWYKPKTRNDFPLHGGEEAVWNGKLACTETSVAYLDQLKEPPSAILLDHRQLLRFLEKEDHPAQTLLSKEPFIVIDDASMLEDTATKAYGWTVYADDLRAGSEGNPLLTRFTDVLQLWIEKVRSGQDIRYLGVPDLTTPEARGLRELLSELLGDSSLAAQVRQTLEFLSFLLQPENLASRFAWIEKRPNGGQVLHSVPERVASLLQTMLYEHLPTVLLIPPRSGDTLPQIIPDAIPADLLPIANNAGTPPISFPITTGETILRDPPAGKTVMLLSGKGPIENAYVRHAEAMEAKGVTLICQGISGGQGRMRAEFLAAKAPVLWLVTPWVFEGLELPPGSVDRLILTQLPFDYYSHPVLSRRAAHYRDGFGDYFFPRLLHRLFRIVRTFCRFKTKGGDIQILDERIRTKGYGKDVVKYLEDLASAPAKETPKTALEQPQEQPPKPKRKASKKKDEGQLSMF
jgi:hypothetical protein